MRWATTRMANTFITLVLGVVIGVLGNLAYQWIQSLYAWWSGRVDLEGYWGQRIHERAERSYSIGQIHYNMRQRMWTFDGTNYHNDGRSFGRWKTVASYVDGRTSRYYYVFLCTHLDGAHASTLGFGYMDLEWRKRAWVPRSGALAAADDPDEAFRSFSLTKLDEPPGNREQVLEVFRKLDVHHAELFNTPETGSP